MQTDDILDLQGDKVSERFNLTDISETLKWAFDEGQTFELRAFDSYGSTHSGYFRSTQEALDALTPLLYRDFKGIYWILNPTKPDIYARAPGLFRKASGRDKDTTKDLEVTRYQNALIDFDPAVGSPGTELEFAL